MGFFPYSGEGNSPRFGDFEAQRHWMELTFNLPINEWYVPSSRNEVGYWGIDYPPLTAYHELVMGYISHLYEPSSVELFSSRGYETLTHRQFVRLSVLISEILTYFPAAYFVSSALRSGRWSKYFTFLALVLSPCLIFVDHGHFQYNAVPLGFLLGATGCVLRGKPLWSAFLFTCAFMFKQTLLYFSPIFFAFMLGEALERRSILGILVRLTKLALVVIGTIAAHIFPFIARCADVDCVKHQLWNILIRIFPFDRGVFEDYVANFWIVISPVIKLRAASRENLRLIGISSTWLTLLGCLPVCWFLATNPRKHLFPLGLAACSLSFYLFSWMVHEKAILLPLTAVLISIPTLVRTKNSDLVLRVTEASVLSLWRLMTYDKCAIGGLAVSVFGYHCLRNTVLSREISAGIESAHRVDHRFMSVLSIFANTIALTGFALDVAVKPPTGLPYLWPLVISAGCFGTFFLSWFRIIHLVWYDSM